MKKTNEVDDKSSWATGGGVLIGLGVGFFFLSISPFYFVGCILGGLGIGLVLSAILSSRKKQGHGIILDSEL